MKKPALILAVFILFFSCGQNDSDEITNSDYPEYILLFIGDGMGFEQVEAAGMYLTGNPGTLIFESFPNTGAVKTYSANNLITDSAAGATAMATGKKVNNGVLSIAIPGNISELETLLEYFKTLGKSTGLISTAHITHATPAAFGAHETSRYNYTEIAYDYLNQARPNILFGGGENGISISAALIAGYDVIISETELNDLTTTVEEVFISGQFGVTHIPYEFDGTGVLPGLSEMLEKALVLLKNDADGFFLVIEGGRIDHAGHDNDIQRNIVETIEFANAVSIAFDFYNENPNTLIIVTADHETGGLVITKNNGINQFPDVTWSTSNHTASNVPIYAIGINSHLIEGILNNTDINELIKMTIQN